MHSQTNTFTKVLAPYALVKDINPDRDDIDNDDSYFVTITESGEPMATEWHPEFRLGIKIAVESIPHVHRQAWHYIGLESVDRVLDEIVAAEQDHDLEGHLVHFNNKTNSSGSSNILIKAVVLNFVDGMEDDGWPGITVIRGLEKRNMAFTGADSMLYSLDSDKAIIKRHLIDSHTPTPGYFDVYSQLEKKMKTQPARIAVGDNESLDEETGKSEKERLQHQDEEEMANKAVILEGLSKLKFPLLVKPANSSSSRGISTKSVVDTPEEAYERAMETKQIWGPVYVEEYIAGKNVLQKRRNQHNQDELDSLHHLSHIVGREYTALVSGSQATGIKVYKVLERVFRSEIPERERMLTHDMKWGENSFGSNESVKTALWWMQICPDAEQEWLQAQAKDIYASFGGNGYCRMDLREDHRTGALFVVDVNANCSIDEDETCAMGKILKESGLTLGKFFSILMDDAIHVRDNLLAKNNGHSDLKTVAAPVMASCTRRHNSTTNSSNTNDGIQRFISVQA
ncbi:hypothetical protein BG011_006759 [Mortierella polycephala]|uniref:ATP-grasp domain-containing protein n=1 Tax=Mortierella polycephala TaxID=41804 RepID=A0A9P6QJP3_9FUNG|nr:hypothetical protein BG011_006759 [Mortierella polycephala]